MSTSENLLSLHVDIIKAIVAYVEGEGRVLCANLQHIRDTANKALAEQVPLLTKSEKPDFVSEP